MSTGPRMGGDGGVMKELLPEVPRRNESPAFLSQLTALVSSVLSYVVFPSMDRIPFIENKKDTVVQVMHVGSKRNLAETYDRVKRHIEVFAEGVNGKVVVNEVTVLSYEECDMCSVVLVDSIRRTHVRKGKHSVSYDSYIDSDILAMNVDKFLLQPQDGVLSIFVFETDAMLLDDNLLAKPYDGFVIAVSLTEEESWITEYQCMQNASSSPIELKGNSSNIDAALVSAVLQTGWGIATPHMRW